MCCSEIITHPPAVHSLTNPRSNLRAVCRNFEGGWITIFGVGVSTSRVATFLSVGTSVFGFVYFNITGWLIERLTVTAVQ